MADVDRGQLLIITGLLRAVVFVGLALAVNRAVYTGTLGSRDTTGEATDALEQQQSVEEELSRTVDRTNTRNKTWGTETIAEEFRDSIENRSDAYTTEEASRGTDVRVDTYNLTNGTRLRQTNASRNFTSANGQTDWQLASDVEESGQFAVDVRNDSLFAATVDGNPVNANRAVDNETVSVDGASTSGATTVSHSGGTDYWIKVTVFDSSSRSTTAALECATSTCEEVAG